MVPVKRTIALSVTGVFCLTALYGFAMDKIEFNDLLPIITMVIGFYFGRGSQDNMNTMV